MNSSMRTFIPPAGLATPTRIRKLISGPIALVWQSTVQVLCGIFREMCENALYLLILSTSVFPMTNLIVIVPIHENVSCCFVSIAEHTSTPISWKVLYRFKNNQRP
ncbi:hypothetical protein CEXT_17381 [Caerostris extrusa]|uniref:Uncharacterized protein n=1 Tax=Caerostris extrusa TaxID=172846 RepID=A0AAV4N6J2_CAEEX|nr:hypothetical protein CEXT_17381 [Caerostris extrusa]